jgi:hypothetical protein
MLSLLSRIRAERKRFFHFDTDIYSIPVSGSVREVRIIYISTLQYHKQGARGRDARFLKLSPASAFSPIMKKMCTVHSTLHLLLNTRVHLPARLKGPRQESQKGVIVKIILAV